MRLHVFSCCCRSRRHREPVLAPKIVRFTPISCYNRKNYYIYYCNDVLIYLETHVLVGHWPSTCLKQANSHRCYVFCLWQQRHMLSPMCKSVVLSVQSVASNGDVSCIIFVSVDSVTVGCKKIQQKVESLLVFTLKKIGGNFHVTDWLVNIFYSSNTVAGVLYNSTNLLENNIVPTRGCWS